MHENVVRGIALSHKSNALAFFRKEAGSPTLWISSPPETDPKKFQNLPANTKDVVLGSLNFSPDGSRLSLWAITQEGTALWILPYPSGEPRRVSLPKEICSSTGVSPVKLYGTIGGGALIVTRQLTAFTPKRSARIPKIQ